MSRSSPYNAPNADTERKPSGVSAPSSWATRPAMLMMYALALSAIGQVLFVQSRTSSDRYLGPVVLVMDIAALSLFVLACLKILRNVHERPEMPPNDHVEQ